ncbi:ferritin heavy chain B-like [Heptranchias perlo]|uniref:ferritin heavy chain B-like n=1 Tax=Heptranchias perlo TaxID=212740 RepID=UPI003559FC1B
MGLALGLSKVVIYRSRLDPAHGDGRSDRLPLFRSIPRAAMALEREHAVSAVNWLRLPFQKPEQDEWSNGLEAMQRALQMEKDVNQSLLDLHKLSTEDRPSFVKLGDHITNLKRLGAPENGMGVYLFDKHTLGESD